MPLRRRIRIYKQNKSIAKHKEAIEKTIPLYITYKMFSINKKLFAGLLTHNIYTKYILFEAV